MSKYYFLKRQSPISRKAEAKDDSQTKLIKPISRMSTDHNKLNVDYSIKYESLIHYLRNMASESDITHKHGAVLLHRGFKPVVWGRNSTQGSNVLHAEMHVIMQFLALHGLLGFLNTQCILRPEFHLKRGQKEQRIKEAGT